MKLKYQSDGVPGCGDDDVGAGDDSGALRLEEGLDVVDEVEAEDAAVLRRRLLRARPVQQQRRVAPLVNHIGTHQSIKEELMEESKLARRD